MSGGGERLWSLLQELGYENYESLDPDSFDWPFECNEQVTAILHWLCSTLRPTNVLSLSELSQYERFLDEGSFLEGEDLDLAHESISAFCTGRNNQQSVLFGTEETLEEIKDATVAYKTEALELRRQLSQLQSQYDMLTEQDSALVEGKRARAMAKSSVAGQVNDVITDSLSGRNSEMNVALGRIASVVEELAHYHSGIDEGLYLRYSDHNQYLVNDLACTEELSQWFTKHLESVPYCLIAEDGLLKSFRVSSDDISNVFLQDSENGHRQYVSELQRLRYIFASSERQWVEAQVKNAKQQAFLLALKDQVASDEAHTYVNLHFLRRKHAELLIELSNLHREEEKLLSESVPDLCSDLAHLQHTYILQDDYDLKIMRQEHYINRQKAFISHLINHLARHQFLRISCMLENRSMLAVKSLLNAIGSELQLYISSTKGRMDHCSALTQVSYDFPEHGAVDDRDRLLHDVRNLLRIYSKAQAGVSTYFSAPDIILQISRLKTDLSTLQSDLENLISKDKNKSIDDLCILIQSLQQLLFASSTTSQPVLSPKMLRREFQEAGNIISQLGAAIDEIVLDHREKEEIIKEYASEGELLRRVFVDFFCAPERLKSEVKMLKTERASRSIWAT